jgi:PucR-like helix-turn-helix protein/diguanylate cyclase with GGDEF domain
MTNSLTKEPWLGLEPSVADVIEPELEAVTGEILETIAAEVPEYARPLEGAFGRGIRRGVGEALSQFVALVRDPEAGRAPGREVYVALGRGELRQGRTLDSLQAAYRVGARVAWRRFARAGRRAKLDAEVLSLLAEAIFAYLDELSADSVEGYAEAQSEIADMRRRRQRELVEQLMRDPPAEDADVRAAAKAAGWKPPRSVAPLACAGGAISHLARDLPADVLVTELDHVGCVLVPDPDGPGRGAALERAAAGVVAALGPTCGLSGLRESWLLAKSTLQAIDAEAIASAGLVRVDRHLGDMLLFEGRDLVARIAARRLDPLDPLTPRSRARMEETALAYLRHRGNAVAMAADLHLHPQTVRYRLQRLRELLGDQLEDPDGRFELELALRRGSVRKTTSQRGEETPKP